MGTLKYRIRVRQRKSTILRSLRRGFCVLVILVCYDSLSVFHVLPTPPIIISSLKFLGGSSSSLSSLPETHLKSYAGKPWYGLCNPHSAKTIPSFLTEVGSSPELSRVFKDFNWGKARVIQASENKIYHVMYRVEKGQVGWSSNPIQITKGETLLTDRLDPNDESEGFLVRGFCCNALARVPGMPILPPHLEPPPDIVEIPPGVTNPPDRGFPPSALPPSSRETPPQKISPPIIMIGNPVFPPNTVENILPPSLLPPCIFNPQVNIPTCIASSFPDRERLFCTKDHIVVRVPICGEEIIPFVPPPITTTTSFPSPSPVPEPSTWVLLLTGLGGAIYLKRKI